jgi:hypothetical protein
VQQINDVQDRDIVVCLERQKILFDRTLPRHHYSVGQVLWFISLVLSAAISLRASSEAMSITSALFGLGVTMPSWSSGRLWLLRLGYYKLTRAKEQAADWVWIVDHHFQITVFQFPLRTL